MMRKLAYLLFIACILSGCAAFGSKTIYATRGRQPDIVRVGYCDPPSKALLRTICPQADTLVKQALVETMHEYGFQPVYMDWEMPLTFIQADTAVIAAFCGLGDLDALLLPEITFLHVTYTWVGIPVARNYDTQTEFKLYDRQGVLLAWVRFNTLMGKSYMMRPAPGRTLTDGVVGAFRKMAKKMGWKAGSEKT